MNAVDFNSFIEELQPELSGESCELFKHPAIPCRTDIKLGKIIDEFAKANTTMAEREQITLAFGERCSWAWLIYSKRMAELAVRQNISEPIISGLIAHLIEGLKLDYRENLCFLALLHTSAIKIGANADQLFRKAEQVASPDGARFLEAFRLRSPDNKQASIMGFDEKQGQHGFEYVRRQSDDVAAILRE